MLYTSMGLMTPADLADHRRLYDLDADDGGDESDWNPEAGASCPEGNRAVTQTLGVQDA
jgi:hypothetical protein